MTVECDYFGFDHVLLSVVGTDIMMHKISKIPKHLLHKHFDLFIARGDLTVLRPVTVECECFGLAQQGTSKAAAVGESRRSSRA